MSSVPTTPEDVQNEVEQANWVTGVILNLIGSFSINFGTNLIQYSHFLTAKYKKSKTRSIKPSAIFCLAWLIFVTGNLLNFISFSFATQTVLSSLGSVQFIANIIFGYLLFKIKPTKIQFLGTILIIIGNICIVSVANKATFKFDSEQLINLFIRIQYVSYLITIVVLSILFQILYSYLMKHSKPVINSLISDSSNNPEVSLNPQQQDSIDPHQGQLPTKRQMSTSLAQLDPDSTWYQKLHFMAVTNAGFLIPSCYAFISAMIGSQSVVLAKSSSFLITESIGSDQQFTQPVTYFFIIAWGVSMTFWLYRMNTALRKYEGAFIIPFLQVLWMLFSILSGGILFKEFDGYSWYNYLIFMIGTIIIFYGVYKLSPQKPDTDIPKTHKNQKEIELLPSTNDKSSLSIIKSSSTSNDINPNPNPSDINIKINENTNEEFIDPLRVQENLGNLRDNDDLVSTNSNQLSTNSLRNSTFDPAISEVENIPRDSTIHGLAELPPDSLSLRTIHKFFTTSQKIIMKVTGADGRTHLSGPSLSSLLTAEDLVDVDGPSFSYNPYNSFTTNPLTNQNELRRNSTYQPQSKPPQPIVTQSLPAVMPSDLKNAFEKIRLDNLKEEQIKKDNDDSMSNDENIMR